MQLLAWKQKVWLQIVVVYTRYLLGGIFVYISILKIKGERFSILQAIGTPSHSPEYFYEAMYQSGLYWQFLGVMQLLAGLLLLTQRYALLGALFFLPIIANIYVITLSYDLSYLHLFTGAMLLAAVGLLVWDWDRVRIVFNQPVVVLPSAGFPQRRLWEALGLVLFLFTVGYRTLVEGYSWLVWTNVCIIICTLGFFIFRVLHRRLKSST